MLAEGECLPALLGLARSGDTETEAYAVWAIEHLSSLDRFQTQIVHDGGLEVLISLAKSRSPEVRDHQIKENGVERSRALGDRCYIVCVAPLPTYVQMRARG